MSLQCKAVTAANVGRVLSPPTGALSRPSEACGAAGHGRTGALSRSPLH